MFVLIPRSGLVLCWVGFFFGDFSGVFVFFCGLCLVWCYFLLLSSGVPDSSLCFTVILLTVLVPLSFDVFSV